MQVKQLKTATFMINHNGFQLSSGLFTATTRACQSHLSVRNKQARDILHVRNLRMVHTKKSMFVCFFDGCRMWLHRYTIGTSTQRPWKKLAGTKGNLSPRVLQSGLQDWRNWRGYWCVIKSNGSTCC